MTAHRRLGLERYAIRHAQRLHENQRALESVRDFGRGWEQPTDRAAQFLWQRIARYELSRAQYDMAHMDPSYRAEYLARLRRYVDKPRRLRLANACPADQPLPPELRHN